MRKRGVKLETLPELVQKWTGLLGLDVKAGFEPSGNEKLFPNRIVVSGADADVLKANRGQALDALQHLVHEMQSERDEDKLAYLDADGMRLFRMREVLAMGQMAAQKARDLGSYTFGAMSPRERRWIHISIKEAGDDLVTESEGTGHLKPVKVMRKQA